MYDHLKLLKKIYKNTLENKTLQNTLVLYSISLVSGMPAFFIPVIVAYLYGATSATDSFFLAYAFINFFITLFGSVISVLIIPYIIEKKGSSLLLNKFLNSLYVFTGYFSVSIILCCYIIIFITKNIISADLYQNLFFLLPLIFFVVINSLSKGILNSLNFFYLSAATPLFGSLLLYLTIIFLHPFLGIKSILIGYLFGELGLFILLIFIIKKYLNLNININRASYTDIGQFWKAGSKQLAGSALIASNPIVDKMLISRLSTGSISILDYGQKIVSAFNSLMSSFLTIMLTKWSLNFVDNKKIGNKIVFYNILVFFISTLIAIPTIFLSATILATLYPKIDTGNINIITMIFRLNLAALIFIGPMQVLNKFAIVYRFTDTILKVAIFKFLSNFLLDLLFIMKFGVIGVAASSFTNQILGYILMVILFRIRYAKEFK